MYRLSASRLLGEALQRNLVLVARIRELESTNMNSKANVPTTSSTSTCSQISDKPPQLTLPLQVRIDLFALRVSIIPI